jgi:putative glutamine amidotransferase
MVPLIAEEKYTAQLAEWMDGILLSGSASDIDPLRYSQEPDRNLGNVTPRRDEMDMMLLEKTEKLGIPVFGICYGVQSINVFRGGTLIQDLPSSGKSAVKHNEGDVFNYSRHTLEIVEGTLLHEIAGTDRMTVNSFHHQAIDVLGSDLSAMAHSTDGIIEAVINTRSDHFMLGVQWHPEIGWEKDALSFSLFKRFIEEAAEYQMKKQKAGKERKRR